MPRGPASHAPPYVVACQAIAIPGPLLAPIYQLRRWAFGLEFRYDLNMRRFHFGGVMDGTRAARELGYRPACSLWPDVRSPTLATRGMSFQLN